MPWLGLAPELILVAGSLVLLVAVAGRPADRPDGRPSSWWGTASVVILAVALLAMAATAPVVAGNGGLTWPGKPDLLGGMLSLDAFSLFFRALFLAVGLLVALLSLEFLHRRAPGQGEYWPLLLWGVLGMMLMASSRHLLIIYLGLELVSLCSYVLAGYLKGDPRSVEAAIKYFLTGAVASAVLLFGITLLYGVAGNVDLSQVASRLAGTPLAYAALLFLAVGFGFKVAAAPLHMWAPDAYEGAPAPVTAFFSVGPKAAAFAALLRVFFVGFQPVGSAWTAVFTFLAVLSMFVGNLAALPQDNIKRMMAYSAIAHAGYILVGAAVGSPLGASAMTFYLLAYVLANLGAFAVIVAVSTSGLGEDVDSFSGLARRRPWLAWAMVLYFLSLIGIPPTAGFFGKFYLFSAALERGQVWLALVMVVNSVISVGYYYRVVRHMFLEDPGEPAKVGSWGWGTGVAAFTTAFLTLGVGIGFERFLQWALRAASVLFSG